MPVDHGLTVPLSVLFGQPEAWPCRVIPLCVNVVQYPPPTGQPLLPAGPGDPPGGRAPTRATSGWWCSAPAACRTSSRRSGPASSTSTFDTAFLDRLAADPEAAAAIPHLEYLREAGSEGIELVMWLVMRGALGPQVREVYRATHVPTSNTHNGLLILENA